MAKPTFDAHWTLLGLPSDTYPPARFWLRPMQEGVLDDCAEVQHADEYGQGLYDAEGGPPLRPGGLACPRIFGRLEAPGARRPAERDRRFGRVTLARVVPHPMRGGLNGLKALPVLPAGLRADASPTTPLSMHPLSLRYAEVLRANGALHEHLQQHIGGLGADAFRALYARLCDAVRDLHVASTASLLATFGASPALRWERLLRLNERAASDDFDPVWADDLDTHESLALLAAMGFEVVPR